MYHIYGSWMQGTPWKKTWHFFFPGAQTYTYVPYCMCAWIMTHVASVATHINEESHTLHALMAHTRVSCRTYAWIVTHVNESSHTLHVFMTHTRMSIVRFTVTHECVRHVKSVNVAFHTWMRHVEQSACAMLHMWMYHFTHDQVILNRGARRRSALARSCCAPTGSDQSHEDIDRGVYSIW